MSKLEFPNRNRKSGAYVLPSRAALQARARFPTLEGDHRTKEARRAI